MSIETLLWSMFSSLSIFSTCETTLSRPGAQTHSAPALPPCIVVLSCLNKWPVRWWMLLSFLHSAAVLAGEGINEKPPKTVRLFISLPHLTHTHTHQPPQHENPNATSFIIQSVCGKTRREAEVLFFPPDLHEWTSRGRVFSHVFCPVSLKWSGTEYQDGKNDLYKAEISQQMTCDCPY